MRLVSTRLKGKPAKGESVEAWARRERRAALARMAHDAGVGAILLAHHRRDQAETVLLQALRGAGPAGLAAMPRAVQRDGLWWLRPWLERPREAIEAYVRQHKLRFVDDASNADERFARSRVREKVWSALTARVSRRRGRRWRRWRAGPSKLRRCSSRWPWPTWPTLVDDAGRLDVAALALADCRAPQQRAAGLAAQRAWNAVLRRR